MATILGTALWVTGCGVPGYDKAHYSEMEQVILQSTNRLVGLTVTEVTNLLHLEKVQWDAGCIPQGTGDEELRIYHFRGFFLELPLTHRSPTPTTNTLTGSVALSDHRNCWVAPPGPSLQIDRIGSPEVRMSNYWDNVQAMFKRAGVDSERIERSLDAETNK